MSGYKFDPRRGAVELATDIAQGEVSAVDLTQAFFERIDLHDGAIGAFLTLDREGALARAEAVDRARAAGRELGPLAGVPIAVKDNVCTEGLATTCASRILEGYRPPYDAHVVERLNAAGAIVLGKTNLDEFAMGSTTETSALGKTVNPWDPSRVPGGSSGGSAAAVAAGFAPLALGSDTGGSVRQPGAFCGITALKPTYGRVSRYGLIAFASSLDQVGPMTRSVRDAARLFGVIAGADRRDSTCVDLPVPDYEAGIAEGVKGLRVGVLRSQVDQAQPEVRAGVEATIAWLEQAGCTVQEVELPHAGVGVSVYYLVANAEASSNLARFDGVRFGLRVPGDTLLQTYGRTRSAGFGSEVKRRILLGTYALSAGYYDAFYLRAQKVRTLIRQDFASAFERCDLLLGPTAPTIPFRLGETVDDPLALYLSDVFTVPASLAGLPAISVPSGFNEAGLPLGVQLTAPAFEEGRLLRAAAVIEEHAGVVDKLPDALR